MLVKIALVVASFAWIIPGTLCAQSVERLSPRQVESVVTGGGTPAEQATYVLECVTDMACGTPLFQLWDKNGAMPMARFVPPPEKLPAMLRGTEIGKKALALGAVNSCNRVDDCRVYLVDAVKSLRALPPEDLKLMYEKQATLDWERAASASGPQIERNLSQSIAAASDIPLPKTAQTREAGLANEAAGKIVDFARDPISGNIFQIAVNASGNRELQRRNPSVDGAKETLANISGRDGKWLIEPVDTAQAPFDAIDVQLTSRGFVAGTRAKIQTYEHGKGWGSYRWPEGFEPAAIQRGDVPSTGYILMERQGGRAGGQLGNAIGQLTYLLGARRDDYLLFDLLSGKAFPINVSTTGKQVSTPYNCKAKNKLVNVCRDLDVRESLIGSLGTKNLQHYAWDIYWFKTKAGTFLIALEDSGHNATVTMLETGEKRLAFNRTLGWADFNARQGDDGRITLLVGAAFQTEKIDDVAERFTSLPPVQAAQGS